MKFSEIPGQSELAKQLAAGVDRGRVSHAQLFSGALSGGGLPLAIAYAQYLDCLAPRDGDSCRIQNVYFHRMTFEESIP